MNIIGFSVPTLPSSFRALLQFVGCVDNYVKCQYKIFYDFIIQKWLTFPGQFKNSRSDFGGKKSIYSRPCHHYYRPRPFLKIGLLVIVLPAIWPGRTALSLAVSMTGATTGARGSSSGAASDKMFPTVVFSHNWDSFTLSITSGEWNQLQKPLWS